MKVCTSPADQRWPNGELPLVVPGLWAANDRMLSDLDDTIDQLNRILRDHVAIRPRRSTDRDYLKLHVTTQRTAPDATHYGRRGGAQDLVCTVETLTDDVRPFHGALIREICRALGLPASLLPATGCALTARVVQIIKGLYPAH